MLTVERNSFDFVGILTYLDAVFDNDETLLDADYAFIFTKEPMRSRSDFLFSELE